MTVFNRLAGAGILAALLSATPALAQDAQAWTDWDGDGDEALTFEEFSQGLAARMNFAGFDADGDGMLSREELAGWIQGGYDLDASGAIEEAETAGLERDFTAEGLWEREVVPEAVTDTEVVDSEGAEATDTASPEEAVELDIFALENWDVDGDGIIVAHEFVDGLADWGTFEELDADADGGVTEDELAQEVFARYDADGNGLIAEPELADMGDDLGEGGFLDG